jgi:hypothetical protein
MYWITSIFFFVVLFSINNKIKILKSDIYTWFYICTIENKGDYRGKRERERGIYKNILFLFDFLIILYLNMNSYSSLTHSLTHSSYSSSTCIYVFFLLNIINTKTQNNVCYFLPTRKKKKKNNTDHHKAIN